MLLRVQAHLTISRKEYGNSVLVFEDSKQSVYLIVGEKNGAAEEIC